ncbi:MAG: general secretion pathway protein GspE, partial [Planctomycetota bacterium]|nr:general secretion pathway protein GspE [Planctomycetota bacterium]
MAARPRLGPPPGLITIRSRVAQILASGSACGIPGPPGAASPQNPTAWPSARRSLPAHQPS